MAFSSHAGAWRIGALVGIALAGTLFACNQILGVEDVKLKANGTRLNNDGGGDDDDTGGTSGRGTSGSPLGDDDDDHVVPPTPDPHPILALGFSHSCAAMLDGTVRCWGSNFNGEIGNGPDAGTDDVLRWKNVSGLNDITGIAAGLSHTCALHKTGKVSCWGEGLSGALGNGKNDNSSVPVDVTGITDAVSVGAGTSVSCVVRKDGTAWCWGSNSNGGLGDGTTADTNVPVKVNDLKNVVQIAPGTTHTCALLSTGEVYCWGAGGDGQLGTGMTTPTTKPTKLTTLSDVAQIAVASRFGCARMKSGKVSCWGRNDYGQLGNGSPTTSANPSPIAVPNVNDAAFIWVGLDHTCAVRTGGAVACWGDGTFGQLGTGPVDASFPKASTPQAVMTITNAHSVVTGGLHTCAMTVDNKAFCWGDNTNGELGNGSSTDKNVPTPVSDFP